MSAFSTSCPNCGAAFIVTPQQLAIANGSVRCGSCMHIFVATQHRTDKPAPIADDIYDFQLGDDDMPEADAEPPQKTVPESEFSDQFLNLSSGHQTFADAMDDDSAAYDDEEWAKNLLANLEDDDEPAPAPGGGPEEVELSAEFVELERSLYASQEQDLAPQAAAGTDDNDAGEPAGQTPLIAVPDDERRRMLSSIQADPLEFTFRRVHWSQVLSRTLLTLGCLVALAAIGAQYAYFNFDTLARDDRFRPWYQLACDHLQCTLPSRDDVTKIQASNLVVRSHPRVANALVVDAMLTNRASHEQPYPELELIFVDLQGKVVAARRLTPSEYLPQGQQGSPLMAPYEPIHMALEIVDPGPSATGYRIVIHPPRKA